MRSPHTFERIRRIRKAIIAPLGKADRLFPACAALSPLLFPLVDRDGLSKTVLQIIVEDAIESGIESIAVQTSEADEAQCRSVIRNWNDVAEHSSGQDDWLVLQREKLAAISQRLNFIRPTLEQARAFIGNDDFAFLPADILHVSGTKDRCLEQLIHIAERQQIDSLLAVETVMHRQALDAVVVRGVPGGSSPLVYQVSKVVRRPMLDECVELFTPGLPPEQFLAATGLAVFSPAIFDVLTIQPTLEGSLNALAAAGQLRAAPLSTVPHDLQNPYGLLAAQLALGLAGIHRVELCEMIARTLAAQAKS